MNRLFKVIVVILFSSLCFSCNAEQGSYDYSEEGVEKESESNFRSSLRLPKNSSITYFHEIIGSDKLTKSIVLMSNESFIDWIVEFHLTLDDFDSNKRYLLGENVGKWEPKSSLTLDTAQINFSNGMVLNIGYKIEDNTQVVVYLVFHGK